MVPKSTARAGSAQRKSVAAKIVAMADRMAGLLRGRRITVLASRQRAEPRRVIPQMTIDRRRRETKPLERACSRRIWDVWPRAKEPFDCGHEARVLVVIRASHRLSSQRAIDPPPHEFSDEPRVAGRLSPGFE